MEENNLLLWSKKVLKHRVLFESIKRSGQKVFSDKTLMWCYRENQEKMNRYGWTVPHYVGNAVFRNRIKRWSRDFLRNFDKIHPELGVDINVLFYSKEREIRYNTFKKSMDRAEAAFFRKRS